MRLLAILIALLIAAPAHADSRDEAKREFAAGQTADKAKDWTNAIDHYLRAYELMPHPFALYNIAVDYQELGKLREAAHYFEQYVAIPDSTDRDRVAKLIGELKARPARIGITTDPAGARVTIDGQVVGQTPFTAKLKGGTHTIVVDRDSRREERTITVEFAEPQDVKFAIGATGTLFVDGTPVGAKVTIDGTVAGEMPVQVPLEVGEHRVQIVMDGYSPIETTARVTAGMVTRIQPTLTAGLGGLGDGSPGTFKLNYLLGFGAGADVRGNGLVYDFEVGLSGKQYEIAMVIGKFAALTSVEFQVRWAMLPGRFSPILGGGYAHLGGGDSGAGYEAFAGLRYELMSTDKLGVTVLGMLTARYNAVSVVDPMTEAPPTGIFPLAFRLQVSYR
ncbi:MAG: PEGA domain-containing protein [Proteobacteria bacterium]|nr:PEGA domain-containing protein [Pseudomonadota bacterium]